MWSSTFNGSVTKIQILATLSSVLLEQVYQEEQQNEERQRIKKGHCTHHVMNTSHEMIPSYTTADVVSTVRNDASTNDAFTRDLDVDDTKYDTRMDKENEVSLNSITVHCMDKRDDSQESDNDTNGISKSDDDTDTDSEFNGSDNDDDEMDDDSSKRDLEGDDEMYHDSSKSDLDDNHIGIDVSNSSSWMQPEWIPMTVSSEGNQSTQKTPQEIRDAIKRYLKSKRGQQTTKTKLLIDLGVNSNSFRKFMDPKNYKDPWRAIENGSYWAIARFLEAERVAPDRADTSVAMDYNKRIYFPPTATTAPHVVFKDLSNGVHHGRTLNAVTTKPIASLGNNAASRLSPPTKRLSKTVRPWKRAKKSVRDAVVRLMRRIGQVEAVGVHSVFDTPSQIVQKIQIFMQQPGVSKANFCREALQGINRKSLDRFLVSSQSKHGAFSNPAVYGRAYLFFEKKRLLEQAPKTDDRRHNELDHGFLACPIRPPSSPRQQTETRRRHRAAAAR